MLFNCSNLDRKLLDERLAPIHRTEQQLTRFGRGGAIAAARGELDLALRWMKFVDVSSYGFMASKGTH
jgi:hypothetical protein